MYKLGPNDLVNACNFTQDRVTSLIFGDSNQFADGVQVWFLPFTHC